MIQFSKNFPDGIKPVYPIDQPQINKWENATDLDFSGVISLRVGKSHGAKLPAALCNMQGLMTSTDEVVAVREVVESGNSPFEFLRKYFPGDWGPMPDHFPEALANVHNIFNIGEALSFDNPKGCAQVVRMDDEGDLYRVLKPWMRSKEFVPAGAEKNSFDFVDIGSGDAVTFRKTLDAAMEKAFDQKWYFGCARPEEVYGGPEMTAYPEGCPGHCSFGAGHGAFSFATVLHFSRHWYVRDQKTRALQPLPQWALKELYWIGFLWAMFRTFAGVHHACDNMLAGYPAHVVGYRAAA